MKIALTGNTGFIGKNLENFFSEKNYEIITLGRHKFNDIKFDILDEKNIKCSKKTKKIDVLIHSASVSVNEFFRKKKITHNKIIKILNYELKSLEKIITFSKINKIKKIIFISSASVYGMNSKKKPFKTNEIANPSNLYGALKLAMEVMGSKLFNNFISLRLFQVYGLNDLKFRLVPSIINSQKIKLKNCCQITDMIFYKDLNNLVNKLILSKKIHKGVFNAGNGHPIYLRNVVKKIIALKKKKTYVTFDKKLPKISNFSYADKNEILINLNWKPKYDINRGLKELIDEYKV